VLVPHKLAIQLQLLGGVWILQTLPAVVVGLYTRWLHRWGLLVGWAVGMALGSFMAHELAFKANVYPLHLGGLTVPGYTALWALIANFAAAIVVTLAMRALKVPPGDDATKDEDYA
jgi:SSS family solute:Na+ symporter